MNKNEKIDYLHYISIIRKIFFISSFICFVV